MGGGTQHCSDLPASIRTTCSDEELCTTGARFVSRGSVVRASAHALPSGALTIQTQRKVALAWPDIAQSTTRTHKELAHRAEFFTMISGTSASRQNTKFGGI